MAALIKGMDIILYGKTETGRDEFNAPIYEETPEVIHNVLISPASSQDIIDSTNLTGKKAEYVLSIPKGDAHEWVNRVVEFYGRRWETVGIPEEYMEHMVPLDWNKKVRVCHYE